ncbi:MAG: ThiF family adenylyltransferase [Steroidobacteraceae bacterium]|nr:ThiF family adenylyltransferase [Steroidobacteraceae bacterium]
MMNYVVRIRSVHHRRFAALLQAAMPAESVAFLLCRRSEGAQRIVYLSDDVVEVQTHEYLKRSDDIASVSPECMARVARIARERNLVVVMMHVHPMTERGVGFSWADHAGNRRSFRFFHNRIKQSEHLSIVWNRTIDECACLAYRSDGVTDVVTSVAVIDTDRWQQCVVAHAEIGNAYDRQAMLLGEEGQRQLGRFSPIIVGAGGTGCLVSMGLVHHGVRRYKIVDDQMIDDTNLPRIINSRPSDVGRRHKVDIAREYALSHAPDADIEALFNHVEHQDVLPHLIAADLIVVCTDNTTSRAHLNEVSQKYLIPLLDVGVQFAVDKSTGEIVNEVGRINLVRPGTACLWCSGHLSAARLAAEATPKQEREREGSYLRGFDDPQPSMLAFNMELVGRALQIVIGYVTGLLAQPLQAYEQRTFLKSKGGSLIRHVAKQQSAGCFICGLHGVVGQGDAVPATITRRAV